MSLQIVPTADKLEILCMSEMLPMHLRHCFIQTYKVPSILHRAKELNLGKIVETIAETIGKSEILRFGAL